MAHIIENESYGDAHAAFKAYLEDVKKMEHPVVAKSVADAHAQLVAAARTMSKKCKEHGVWTYGIFAVILLPAGDIARELKQSARDLMDLVSGNWLEVFNDEPDKYGNVYESEWNVHDGVCGVPYICMEIETRLDWCNVTDD
jgi:hypothetical protein